MQNKVAHLQMIQAVIQRMANASFMIRGWAVTLVAGIFAIAHSNTERVFFVLAYFPILAFWVLDGFYLSKERAFRALFLEVRNKGEKDIDFSMDISPYHKSCIRACFSGLHFLRTELR